MKEDGTLDNVKTINANGFGTVMRSLVGGHEITTFLWQNTHWWGVIGIGRVLGYKNGGRKASDLVCRREEFKRPRYCRVLTGKSLASFMDLVESDDILSSGKHDGNEFYASRVTLISARGLALLCAADSEKKIQGAILEWLKKEGLVNRFPLQKMIERIKTRAYRLPDDYFSENGIPRPEGTDPHYKTDTREARRKVKMKDIILKPEPKTEAIGVLVPLADSPELVAEAKAVIEAPKKKAEPKPKAEKTGSNGNMESRRLRVEAAKVYHGILENIDYRALSQDDREELQRHSMAVLRSLAGQ